VDEQAKTLTYSKSSSLIEKPAGVIDFQLVVDISPHVGKNGKHDYLRFDIDVGEGKSKTFKFRAGNEADGQRWVQGLNEWRDYFLLSV
jgi:hypothetical protein